MSIVKRALLSVTDKTGIVEFARGLADLGVEILSTGGTANVIKKEGIPVKEVSEHTGFPEMMDGRIKTLHPVIHGGILARRDLKTHLDAMVQHDIGPIDLVAVNLYAFEDTIAKDGCKLDDAIENIDIGGPAMLRSSAKNHKDVLVLVDPEDYKPVLDLLKTKGDVPYKQRLKLAIKVFETTNRYDSAISVYLSQKEKTVL